MGCLLTKRVPEVPRNGGILVEPVYGQSCDNVNLNESGQLLIKTKDGEVISAKTYTKGDIIADSPEPGNRRSTKKVARYKAKFDARVMAKYDIKALIGRGTYSRVVRVENRLTKQPYAIKMVDRVRGREMCEAELSVLRRVRHDNIIQLVEVFESRDKMYLIVELATGGELFERIISKGSFTEQDASRVLRMVIDGLRYLHSLGIAHRDLKPENLLYYHPGADSKILITDFGLSASRKVGGVSHVAGSAPGKQGSILGEDGSMDEVEGGMVMEGGGGWEENCMRTTCGTPEYIAPEVLARQPYTCQVDLWAVGVISYILLSGMMPFDEENRAMLYRRILKAKYSYEDEHWKDISSSAKHFIDSLLTVDPTLRLTAQQALTHDWIASGAASSSCKNLHRTISRNLAATSASSARTSDKYSGRSAHSTRSGRSLHSERRRVEPEEIDALHRDPEVQEELSSLAGSSQARGAVSRK